MLEVSFPNNGADPWEVEKIEDFLFFCCPTCDDKIRSKEDFLEHAINQHPESKETLDKVLANVPKKKPKRRKCQVCLRWSKNLDNHTCKEEYLQEALQQQDKVLALKKSVYEGERKKAKSPEMINTVDDPNDSYNDEEVDVFEENDDNAAEFIKQENTFDEDFCRSALQFEEKFFSDADENINVDELEIDIKENLKSEIDDSNCNGGEDEIYDLQDDHCDILKNDIFKKEESSVVDDLDAVLKLHKLDPKSLQQYQSTNSYGQKQKLLQSLCDIQDRKETLGVLTQPHKLSDNVWVCHFCYNTFSSKYR